MKVVSANIMNVPDMPREYTVADGRTAKSLAEPGGIIGFQELGGPFDWVDIQAALGSNYRMFGTYEGVNLQIPIAYDFTRWTLVASSSQLMCPSNIAINSPRYAVWGSFRPKSAPSIKPLIVCNTHMPPGVRPLKAAVTAGETLSAEDQARLDGWQLHWNRMKVLIDGWRTTPVGRAVVVLGDTNDDQTPAWANDEVDLFPNRIDKIRIYPGTVPHAVWSGKRGNVNLHSDHDAIWADVTLS